MMRPLVIPQGALAGDLFQAAKTAQAQASRQRHAQAMLCPDARHSPVTDCRIASQLLITISAAVNFSSLSQAR